MKRNNLKIEYVALLIWYTFIFVCMPSLHCHFQYLDWTLHCFHCNGHIDNVAASDNDTCDFCPVINFNAVCVPLSLFLLVIILLFKNNNQNFIFYENFLIENNLTRGPPNIIF